MRVKDTYIIKVWNENEPEVIGVGECNLFAGLSADDCPDYEKTLDDACAAGLGQLPQYSSIIFGAETALADMHNGGKRVIFDTEWRLGHYGIPINGLVWMGDKATMLSRLKEKLEAGFRCVKLKIGGIKFDDELDLLKYIRRNFSERDLEIRLDANGAFRAEGALARLESLSRYRIHSIEQPIKAGQWEEMARLCQNSPMPIALDEELIGVRSCSQKNELLDAIKPHYIILKPALCGGFVHSDQWIELATQKGIGWWATSALESNIGLNAIAQWASTKKLEMPQGLGTGNLYLDNCASPIEQKGDRLFYNPHKNWSI